MISIKNFAEVKEKNTVKNAVEVRFVNIISKDKHVENAVEVRSVNTIN